jgi:hypothetical protein
LHSPLDHADQAISQRLKFRDIACGFAQLQKFYAEMFDWKIDSSNPMGYGLVDTDSDGQGIGGGVTANENGPSVTIYVEVPDLDAALARVATLGGKTVMEPTVIPDMVTFAVFADPEGNMIGMVKSA